MIKKILILNLSIPFFIFLHLQTHAINYFVSTIGSNANSGLDIENTFLTIQFGLNKAGAGDTVFVLAGTYFEQLTFNTEGASDQFLTLKNYENDSVIIDGSLVGNYTELVFLQNREYISIDGLHFINHNGNYQPIINCYGNNAHIEIRNCTFYQTNCNESYAILIEGYGDYFTIENNHLHDLLGTNALGIAFFGTNETTPLSNIKIINNLIENIEPAPSESIVVNGNVDGFEIASNTIKHVNNIGIDMIGGENWVNSNDSVNIARNGICKNNFVQHANSIYGGGYAAGIYVDGGKNIIIENNTVTGSDIGLEIGCENAGFNTENITVRNNILYKNEKSGLGFGGYNYPSTGKVINCNFTGNTVFDNDSLNTGFGQLWIQYAENCVVENNIFYASATSYVLNAYDWDITTLGNQLNYNLYYYHSPADAIFYYNEIEILGFENYLIASNQDSNSLFIDPIFVDESIFDFHLSALSPAIDAGDNSFISDSIEVDMDAENRIQNMRIDIGADEFTTSVQSIANAVSTNTLLVYPNPTSRMISLLLLEKINQITCTDAIGKKYFLQTIMTSNTFDASSLPPGIYIVECGVGNKFYTTTIMIQ